MAVQKTKVRYLAAQVLHGQLVEQIATLKLLRTHGWLKAHV